MSYLLLWYEGAGPGGVGRLHASTPLLGKHTEYNIEGQHSWKASVVVNDSADCSSGSHGLSNLSMVRDIEAAPLVSAVMVCWFNLALGGLAQLSPLTQFDPRFLSSLKSQWEILVKYFR